MNTMEKKPLVNYHSHTWRCKHAGGTEEEYVRQAIETGYAVLGFADHSPWPYKSDFESRIRMRVEQLPDYLQTVRALGEKYRGQIYIPVGLECEAFPEYYGWLKDLKAEQLDYLILGNHFELNDETGGFYFGMCREPDHVKRYVKCTIDGMRTGLFDYVAHADLCCAAYPRFDAECAAALRDLCAAAKDLDIPLEYNLLGVQRHEGFVARGSLGYPCAQFWEVAAETGCKAIVGVDAHETEQLSRRDLYEGAWAFLGGLGLEIVPVLPGLDGKQG